MTEHTHKQTARIINPASLPISHGMLQRKCACGQSAGLVSDCESCAGKKRVGLKTKLRINEPGDSYEQEADRVADQVMAMPVHSAVSSGPLRIQRIAAQSTGRINQASISVDETLANPGQPLAPALRQDMEQRFGHDFSRVRVHYDALAAQTARDLDAHAFAVGNHIVFGSEAYSPGTQAGRRLLAHELTHVIQQSGTQGIGDGRSANLSSSPLAVQRAPYDPERSKGRRSTLPYREAKNFIDCIRIMGPDNAAYCRREVLGEDSTDAAPGPTPAPVAATTGKTARVLRMESLRKCAYTVIYSNPRKVDCITAFKTQTGSAPTKPVCGAALVYDIVSVSAVGSGCPAKLDGLKVSEVVKGDQGCTPPGFVWPAPIPCVIGSGGKLTGCTDTFTLCGETSRLKGSGCTEIVDQEIEVGGQLAEEHEIVFDLKKSGTTCTGTVTRN